MRTRLIALTLFVAAVGAQSGCAFKASDEECNEACGNVSKVTQTFVYKQIEETEDLAKSGEGGKEMARSMATAMIDALKDECMKQCVEKGTRKQAACLSAAPSVEELHKCK
jgi:hypothetical protein